MCRKYADHDTEELSKQLRQLREKERSAVARSNELQHLLLDVEEKLKSMVETVRSLTSDVRLRLILCVCVTNAVALR